MSMQQLFELFRTEPRFFLFGMICSFIFGCCIGSASGGFRAACPWFPRRRIVRTADTKSGHGKTFLCSAGSFWEENAAAVISRFQHAIFWWN